MGDGLFRSQQAPAPPNSQSQPQGAEPPLPASTHDPYQGLPLIGNGLTGYILNLGDSRAVIVAKKYDPGSFSTAQVLSEMNQEILENEINVYKRLGTHPGIIPYYRISSHGIELPLAQGDLESYLETYSEPEDVVFIDDIALRNILVLDEKVYLADFGQSVIWPLDIDITSANDKDLTARIRILHLGWLLYSIATWDVPKYYFFDAEDPSWPAPDSFPNVNGVLGGEVIRKCWLGEYASMEDVRDEAGRWVGT
ncbi:hypothetical protein BJY04DRAFT_211563 [Aspergillus karnatakaensis]|uniref:uncharacterized protein n=1 Tax=Aspergillus karnatakaensis TaxID=1810916 RepID=UPI003CCD7A07